MDVLTVDYRADDAQQQFTKSLRETGFGIIRNHPIDWHLVEEVYTEWYGFFNDPRRYDYLYDKDKQDGYIPLEKSETAKGFTKKDIKEFYHLYYPWGRYPEFMSDASRKLFDQMFALGKKLMQWIENELPEDIRAKLSRPLTKMVSVKRSLHRVLYYPPFKGDEEPGAIRAAAHEDINLITVLPAATESGLQAMDLKGNWHNVKVDPETIVINIADMLQEATDGYYRSTTHRVINPEGASASKARLSLPLFIHAHADVRLSDRYPTAEGYLRERLHELGLKKKTS